MINIIFDGHMIVYQILFYSVYKNYFDIKNNKSHLNEKTEEKIIDEILNKIYNTINKIVPVNYQNLLGKIYFTYDYDSWRKQYLQSYKTNRIKLQSQYNWDTVYSVINKLNTKFKDWDIFYLKIKGAEGDDIIAKMSEFCEEKKESLIIVANDSDLNQLLKFNKDTFILRYENIKNYFVCPEKFLDLNETLDNHKIDIFTNKNIIANQIILNDYLKFLRNNFKFYITDDMYIKKKILLGDKSDNIQSIISEKIMEKNKKQLEYYLNDFENLMDFIMLINSEYKDKNTLKQQYKLNEKLILLNKNNIPEDLQEKIVTQIKLLYNKTSNNRILEYLKFKNNNSQPTKTAIGLSNNLKFL